MLIAHKPWWSQSFLASLLALLAPNKEEIVASTLPISLSAPPAPIMLTHVANRSSKGRKLNKKRYNVTKRHSSIKVGCPTMDIEPMYIHKALGISDNWTPDEWVDSMIEHNCRF